MVPPSSVHSLTVRPSLPTANSNEVSEFLPIPPGGRDAFVASGLAAAAEPALSITIPVGIPVFDRVLLLDYAPRVGLSDFLIRKFPNRRASTGDV